MGSASKRTFEPSLNLTSQRGLGLPKMGKAYGAGVRRSDRSSLPENPVESTTLRLRKTNLRNEVTTPVLSV
jgi:hypothetical protein